MAILYSNGVDLEEASTIFALIFLPIGGTMDHVARSNHRARS
jgi:hypothetical protein